MQAAFNGFGAIAAEGGTTGIGVPAKQSPA
jgi:hypothetical protein